MKDHPFEYQLEFRPSVVTDSDKAQAYKALSELGEWFEGMWWKPTRLLEADVLALTLKDFKVKRYRSAGETDDLR